MKRPANLLNGIDLVTLRILLAAQQEGNLARVAERENIAISAVSRRITEFEARFGVTIFDRHDRGVTATPDGKALLNRLLVVMGDMEQIAGELFDRRDGLAGVIRIHAHNTSIVSGLPDKLAHFIATNPKIDFLLEEQTSLEVIHSIRAGICDFGLISGTVDSRGLETIPMEPDELVAVLPLNSPLAARERLSLGDLLDYPFVGMQKDSSLLTVYRAQATACNRVLKERVHATSFDSVRACVAAGLGVSILPLATVEPFVGQQAISLRALSDSWARRPLTLCYRSRQQMSAAARSLLDYLASTKDRPSLTIRETRLAVVA